MADLKQLALAHFDKAILAGFGVWAAFAVTGFFQKPPELTKGEEIKSKLGQIGEYMGKASVPEPKGPTWEADLKSQLDLSGVPTAKPFPSWLLEKRPYFLYFFKTVQNTESAKHFPPTDIQGDGSTRGRIVVRWTPSTESTYVVCTYEVMRKVGDAGAWAKIADAGSGTTEYTDTKLAPRSKYFYKVVSVASVDQEAPTVIKHGLTLPQEESRKESGECGPFETPRDVFVLPQGISPITEQDIVANNPGKDANHDGKVDEKDESAYVTVYKWDVDSQKFLKKNFNVNVGQGVGEKARLAGRREFDFTTGATLDDVWTETRKNERLGNDETVQWVRIKFADGTTDQWNNKDKPTELGNE